MAKLVSFIEAINSGKRFKTPSMEISWFELNEDKTAVFQCADNEKESVFELTSLANAQFILEEKSITITESEFDKLSHYFNSMHPNNLRDLKKELGF